MGFKKFRADVSTAAQKVASGAVSGVLSVTNGDSDGNVVIKYHHDSLTRDIHIQALAQDVGEYPNGNMFLLWTDDSDPPPPVVAAVNVAQDCLSGLSVYEMVTVFAGRLEREISRAVEGEDDSLDEYDDEDESDDYDAAYDADYPSDGDEFGLPSSTLRSYRQRSKFVDTPKSLLQRIRRDLRQAKQAGYKVGFLDPFGRTAATGIISISIRVDKLALSDGAMEAWDLNPTEYVVLLIRFTKRYDPLELVVVPAASHTEVTFRIGKCNKHKPSLHQALSAFAEPTRAETTEEGVAHFEKLFISNSLESFLNEGFVSLLKIREMYNLDWEKANEQYLTHIALCTKSDRLPQPLACPQRSQVIPDLAADGDHVLGQDHLLEKGPAHERSLPLVAMQFAMRYFVKCTEYCLRCHRRLEKGFEALRPYVCPNPLCLFQYMAMGFGPAVEHEILTEPYVVDLLVSLCYTAIQPYKVSPGYNAITPQTKLPIRSLPVGLRLLVPDLSNATATPLKAKVTDDNNRLVFDGEGAQGFVDHLAPARWLAFRTPGKSRVVHARVREVTNATKTAVIEVMAESAVTWASEQQPPVAAGPQLHALYAPIPRTVQPPPSPAEASIADVYPYDTDFDSMDDNSKGYAMRHLLDTLPSILDIGDWLSSHPHNALRSVDRVSPAAASLLRWIVSSNRSCIFQVDGSRPVAHSPPQQGSETMAGGPKGQNTEGGAGVAGKGRDREDERILGMEGWIQFCFAQGSPDKELRFSRALQEVAARKPIHGNPTIFAWHGSSIANWHSIVRTGLDFQDVRCGRSFGHGVYFSPHLSTSLTYCGPGGQHPWPNSDLNITSCLSLNEIINAPDEFVATTPHYVVSQLDWHQCRYLFVKAHGKGSRKDTVSMASNIELAHQVKWRVTKGALYPQAPGLEIRGEQNKQLQIPLSAVPFRTIGPAAGTTSSTPAKRAVCQLEDSDGDEDAEDVSILVSDDDDDAIVGPPAKKSASPAYSMGSAITQVVGARPPTPASINIDRAMTDFVPGSLDLSSLLRLAPPSFATDTATRSLSRELVRLQNLQATTPLHELGWYIDFDAVSNLYHWIVELHSFDPSLPLAQDMKQAGVGSVVLEMRFGSEYPFAPPFVRVVRPRFLTFMAGGGGHVTAGGAMCMELLTSSGWSPVSSMESVLLQVRVAMCGQHPKPARLDRRVVAGKKEDYGVGEAIEAFERAVRSHGWAVPKDLRVTANGM